MRNLEKKYNCIYKKGLFIDYKVFKLLTTKKKKKKFFFKKNNLILFPIFTKNKENLRRFFYIYQGRRYTRHLINFRLNFFKLNLFSWTKKMGHYIHLKKKKKK